MQRSGRYTGVLGKPDELLRKSRPGNEPIKVVTRRIRIDTHIGSECGRTASYVWPFVEALQCMSWAF